MNLITVYNQLFDELISGINSRFNQEIVQLVQTLASMICLDYACNQYYQNL